MRHFVRHLASALLSLSILASLAPPALAQAPAKPPVKLGFISSMTGPLASLGKGQELMVRLAVEDINAQGGINGSPLQVDTADAQLDPGQAVLMFRKFAGEGYVGVVGPISGTQWETVTPLANQLGMPAITATASKPGITIRPWTLRMYPPDDLLIADGFNAFRKLYPAVRNVVILADFREASGKSGAEAFEKLAREAGLKVLQTVEFSTRATDLSPAAIQVKSLNPDAVLASALAPNALMLAKEFKVQNLDVPVLANSLLWPGTFVNTVGEAGRRWHTIGFTTNDTATGSQSANESVVKRYTERADASFGRPANVANMSVTYDAVMLYADILRRAGVDGRMDSKQAREAVKSGFMKLKSFSAVQSYTFRDSGDAHIPGRVLGVDLAHSMWKFASP